MTHEQDPNNTDQHAAGAKLDRGKVRCGLVLGGFARALWAVSEVGTAGAKKYSDNGWMSVPNGEARYTDAGMRHFLKLAMGERVDPDFGCTHLAHEAWNALARLELAIRAQEAASKGVPETSASEDISAHVIKCISRFTNISISGITVDKTVKALHIDSLDIVEMSLILEDEFDIDISDAELNDLQTVQDIINLVAKKIRP